MLLTSEPFPMYDLPELAEAHERLWHLVVEGARRRGIAGRIAVTQRCGYPLVTSLRGKLDVVAAPVYDVPYGVSATHCGLIVTRADGRYESFEDLRGTRFAMNERDSNTGMNLPRRLFAPIARRGRFFGEILVTGSHAASLEAVRRGIADVASVDSVTFALLAQRRPVAVEGLRILAPTAPSPSLPFVVPAGADSGEREALFDALAEAVDEIRRTAPELRLTGVRRASIADYLPLLVYEREAVELDYGTLA